MVQGHGAADDNRDGEAGGAAMTLNRIADILLALTIGAVLGQVFNKVVGWPTLWGW
jgi:hypothetical protein